jgi:Zinc finger, C2H2 type
MTNYPCPNCERVFSRRSSLRNHVKTHENIVDRVLREISEDTRQEDAASGGEQQFGQEENPVFGDEQRGDEQREEEQQEFEEEEQQQEFEEEQQQQEFEEEEEQEFEEENPEEEEGSSSHSSLSNDSEEQEDAVIISYLIYTAIAMYIDKIDKLYVDKLSMYYHYRM